MNVPASARLFEHARRLASLWRVARFRTTGVQFGPRCVVESHTDLALGFALPRRGRLALAHDCTISQGVIIQPHGGSVRLGHSVYVGPYSVIYGHGGVEIGDDTLISMHCRILSSDHALPPPDIAIRAQSDILKPTRIGCDVWLGAGVTVLGGVTIGDGCVVGAGAVVSRDLPPRSIAVGVPAKVVRSRT